MSQTNRVLIAGAGPAGLVAALGLARQGVPVAVFEQLEDRALDMRASTIHPPTLEMLSDLGIIDRILADGIFSPYWQFRDRKTGPIATFDLGVIADETRYPFRVQCEQFKVTAFLLEALAEIPHASVHFKHRVISARQDSDLVTLTLEHDGETIEESGRYLIAADGASSAIRRNLDIPFEGYTFPERFLVVSTPYDLKSVMPDLSVSNYITDPDEWLVLLRVRDFWRVLFPTRPDEKNDEVLSDRSIQARLRQVASIGMDFEIAHKSLYLVHQRVAATYLQGRILLAGDAAHINNPLGGMGMNGGIHDAVNLVEKLSLVWNGGEPELLARYSRQRRAIALDYVQQWTVKNREIMMERDPEIRNRNMDDIRRIAEDAVSAKKYLLKTSMIASLRQAAAVA